MSNDAPNVFTSLVPDFASPRPFEDGDGVIILKANGEVKMMSIGIDTSRLTGDPALWTDADKKAIVMGQRLFALSFAAGHPVIMNMLHEIARDPDVVDFDKLAAARVAH